MFEHWMDTIGDSVGGWFYLIAAFCCYAEAAFLAGLVFPAEAALLVAGVFAERGVLNLPLMIVIAFVCAVAGDSTGYEFGRKFGPGLRSSKLGQRIGNKRWLIVDEFLHRHGGKAVFFGRLTALLRAMVPSMAGMSKMPYRTFLFWNVLGGAVWAPGSVLLGYAFSSSLGAVSKTLTWAPFALLAIVVFVVFVIHRRSKKTEAKLLEAASHDPELAEH
ncbi:MAG TPA: DedA family protein [Mycobacteriales bacterium]|jgi:membrane protein DedA with SNARE-associated domain|nr:DedA family protein [Mycobacteriales bacterium]HVX69372.1 DedA family protein [Mycobacteriales bacterium]